MIKFENTEVVGWEHAIRGMRNPMNSWEKGDSGYGCSVDFVDRKCSDCDRFNNEYEYGMCVGRAKKFVIGPNDLNLMKRLRNAGTDHRKFMRMITVYVDITAPLYWWKEFDTYRVGTVVNSCSTMHKIHVKEFTLEDFSTDQLFEENRIPIRIKEGQIDFVASKEFLQYTIDILNAHRRAYLETKEKCYWWQMIQLLPSSYNQKRTVMMNYEVLANIYKSRRNHKLDEWAEHKELGHVTGFKKIDNGLEISVHKSFGFCDWIKTLPYSELITG